MRDKEKVLIDITPEGWTAYACDPDTVAKVVAALLTQVEFPIFRICATRGQLMATVAIPTGDWPSREWHTRVLTGLRGIVVGFDPRARR